MKILIVVTHLLGTGHLKRSMNLAQAFVAAGHSVTLVSGGIPVAEFIAEDVQVLQLPPLCSDGTDFGRLLTVDGAMADESYLASRGIALTRAVKQIKPEVVITELFPFGRRVLQTEFLQLLQSCKTQPETRLILASVRDILSAPSTPAKAQKTEELIAAYYDGVLVHSDADTTPLEHSWPVTARLSEKLYYTGYVASTVAVVPSADILAHGRVADGVGEIIVSTGGGAVGRQLFEMAIKTAKLTGDTRWRLLVGGATAHEDIDRLCRADVPDSVLIEPARTDFRTLLEYAACSVSLCGYNTAVDLLQSGTPGVFVPFDEGGEVEQVIRAVSLSRLPSFEMILARQLTPELLGKSISSVRAAGRVRHSGIRFDGAAEAVRHCVRLLEDKA